MTFTDVDRLNPDRLIVYEKAEVVYSMEVKGTGLFDTPPLKLWKTRIAAFVQARLYTFDFLLLRLHIMARRKGRHSFHSAAK